MLSFKEYLLMENVRKRFNNWVRPSDKDIETEYEVEFVKKGMDRSFFPTAEHFKEAVKKSKVITVTPALDQRINYRSRTTSKRDLLSLISGYRSFPKFRNEGTLEMIYKGFDENKPMKMPFVLKFPDGRLRVLSGNTRMDVAFQLGINPKVILIEMKKEN